MLKVLAKSQQLLRCWIACYQTGLQSKNFNEFLPIFLIWRLSVQFPPLEQGTSNAHHLRQLPLRKAFLKPLGLHMVSKRFNGCRECLAWATFNRNMGARSLDLPVTKTQQC